MRVLLVSDKPGSAIHRMCEYKIKHTPWHAFKLIAVHPKRPDPNQLEAFEEALAWCDVVDFQYWKTAETLHSLYEIKKPSILTHHNPYDLTRTPWTNYKINVVLNTEQLRTINTQSVKIEHPVDTEFWEYQPTEPASFRYGVIMVSNRIEAKKGVLPVAQACKDLGIKMALVGDISDRTYHEQVMATEAVDFFHRISDEDLRDLYHQSMIHVCNSVDGYESGTLPILEAMSCGTPVLTRRIGHVPDTFNGRNMQVRRGDPDDLEDLKKQLTELTQNKELRDEIRQESVHSLRYRNYEIYARKYSQLYHQLLTGKELVTAIVPTVSTPDKLIETLSRVMSQTYGPLEIIVADDSEQPELNEEVIKQIRGETSHTIKFFATATRNLKGEKTYGLARARNKAVMEAEGQWLWFVDERMLPEKEALDAFYERRKEGIWLWGMKDQSQKSFVENFSFVNRKDLLRVGAFNEQITQYGGMTQEVRTRWEQNKKILQFVPKAQAITKRKSNAKWRRYKDIAISKTQCYKLYG